MRILHVTDLHFVEHWYEWLAAEIQRKTVDVTCVSGDWLNMFADFAGPSRIRAQAKFVREFLEGIQDMPLFAVTGNHDLETGNEMGDERDFLARAAQANPNVRGDFTLEIVEDLRFYCHPWGHGAPLLWPYPEPACLLSHAPPIGTGLSIGETGECGDPDIRSLVMKLPPGSLVLSGHVHTPKKWFERVGNAWCFNPGCADYPRPAATPNHIIIDTRAKTAELRTARGNEIIRID